MTNIINHQTKQINITFIPEQIIDINEIKTESLKTKIETIFKDSKVMVTQFPDVVLIVDPNNRISINAIRDLNKIIIADNNTSQYEGRPLHDFLHFVTEVIKDITDSNIRFYGFNISSIFDLGNGEIDSGNLLLNRLINKGNIMGALNKDLNAAGVKLVYYDGDIRYQLKLDPRFGKNMEVTKTIIVDQNAHFQGPLPPLTKLEESCNKIYSELNQNLIKIFS